MASQNIIKLQNAIGNTVYPVTHMSAVLGVNEKIKELENSGSKMLKIAYADLVALRDNSELIPGQMYRIIDYVCTSTQEETRAMDHAFDIIVTATDVNRLSELCRAIQHEGDTYFENSNLDAWQIWYDLDNDVTKYMWADPENGKGVIYRMIDEFENDCPYDFKNIQFKRYWCDGIDIKDDPEPIFKGYFGILNHPRLRCNESIFIYAYTFCYIKNFWDVFDNSAITSEIIDISLNVLPSNSVFDHHYFTAEICKNNKIGIYSGFLLFDDGNPDDGDDFTNTYILSNNVFYSADNTDKVNTVAACYDNILNEHCGDNTFGAACYSNTFGNYCDSNTFGNYCDSNTFGNYCDSNTFGNYCYSNTFGNYCYSNTFGNYCYSNTFGNYCYSNTFGMGALKNDLKFDNIIGVRFDDTVSYINLKPADTTAVTLEKYLCNIHILRGVHGGKRKRSEQHWNGYNYTDITPLNIVIDTYSQDYEICVGFDKEKNLVIWDSTPI